MAHQVDRPIDEHPPKVSVLTLPEQVDTGLDAHLGAGLDQLRELIVGETVEDAERAEIVDPHQIVAR